MLLLLLWPFFFPLASSFSVLFVFFSGVVPFLPSFFYRVSTFFYTLRFLPRFPMFPIYIKLYRVFQTFYWVFTFFFSSNRLKSIYTQFYRVFPCLTGFLRFFSNFYRVLLRFTEFYRVSPRLTGHFFTCFLISTEFCYVLPGSTEFYRVFVQFHVML